MENRTCQRPAAVPSRLWAPRSLAGVLRAALVIRAGTASGVDVSAVRGLTVGTSRRSGCAHGAENASSAPSQMVNKSRRK